MQTAAQRGVQGSAVPCRLALAVTSLVACALGDPRSVSLCHGGVPGHDGRVVIALPPMLHWEVAGPKAIPATLPARGRVAAQSSGEALLRRPFPSKVGKVSVV